MEKGSERLRRVFHAELAAGVVELGRNQGHYVRDVLRLGTGNRVVLFDGAGHCALATLMSIQPIVLVEVHEVTNEVSSAMHLTVALAAPKGSRADWAVEKLTELGVENIVWLECARSVVKLDAGGAKVARHARLAQAAARQAGRSTVPEVLGPVSLAALSVGGEMIRLVADPSASLAIQDVEIAPHAAIVLAIGPEGGFTAHELESLRAADFLSVRLGPFVLRTETAAVAGTAQLACRSGFSPLPLPARPGAR